MLLSSCDVLSVKETNSYFTEDHILCSKYGMNYKPTIHSSNVTSLQNINKCISILVSVMEHFHQVITETALFTISMWTILSNFYTLF